MNFLYELKRRNVFKMGVAYLVGAWLLLQLLSILLPTFNAPEWIMQVAVVFLALGFFIALFIAWAFEMTPEGIKPTTSINPEESIAPQTGQKLNMFIISALSLVVVFLVVDNYVLKDEPVTGVSVETQSAASAGNTSPPNQQVPVISDEKTIAVLPFRDLSPAADQGWFADGVSEEIRNLMTRIRGLDVINTNSSFTFRGQEEELEVIREGLNVNYVLSGSIRRAGDDLRVTVQVSDTRDGRQLWSDNYQGTLADIFTVQEDIAARVAQALEISLGVGELGTLADMTRNPEAYALYLEAINLAGRGSESAIRRVDLLEQALALDPEFMSAAFTLLSTYSGIGAFTNVELPKARMAELREQILSLQPDHPTLKILAFIEAFNTGNWLEAESLINSLNSSQVRVLNDLEGNFLYGGYRIVTRSLDENIAWFERQLALDPLNGQPYFFLAESLMRKGELERALEVVNEGVARTVSDDVILEGTGILIMLAQGDTAKLQAQASDYVVSPNDLGSVINSIGFNNLTRPETGIQALKTLLAENADLPEVIQIVVANWLAYFGDAEGALAIHHARVQSGNSIVTAFDVTRPLFREMRKLPEFKLLIAELGLEEYWRTTGNWGYFCRPLPNTENDFECF